MGLTESNQSKSSFWGPSRSKSTQFLEGRSYEGRPRQAATLPARPISHDQNSSVLLSSEKKDDGMFSLVRGRPPDRAKQRNRSLQRDPISFREARATRSIVSSQSVERKKNRQSDPLLDFSASPLSLASNIKWLGNSPLSKHERISSYVTPNNIVVGDVSPQPQTKSIYSEDKNGRRTSLGRSGGRDSSCGRKECKKDCTSSNEKETQTFSPSVLYTASAIEEKNKISFRSDEKVESFKQFGQKRNRGSVRKTTQPLEKISCSVPASPNEIESDPYICLYYSNVANHEPFKGNRSSEPLKDSISCPRVYSEASLYMANEGALPAPQRRASPAVNKRSQILIKVDNNDSKKMDTSQALKWNSEAIEVCSNVWFESKTIKHQKECVRDCSSNGDTTQEMIHSECINFDSAPVNAYLCEKNRILDNQEICCTVNEKELDSRVLSCDVDDAENENNLKDQTSWPQDESLGLQMSVLKLASEPSDDCESVSKLNLNTGDYCKNEDCNSNSFYTAAVTKNKQIPLLSLGNRCHAVPELWLTEDYHHDNENGVLPEDKAIPNPSAASTNHLIRNEDSFEKENLTLGCPTETKKHNESTSICNIKQHDIDGAHFSALSDGIPSPNDFTNSATTLPSISPFHSQFSGCPEWNRNLSRNYPEMLRRKTIHTFDIGIFPVLRLPKSESQPRLVDVLRKKTEKTGNDSSRSEEGRSSSLLHDSIFTDSHIGSGVKYSPVDENILYITEDSCDKSSYDLMKNRDSAIKILKTHSFDLPKSYVDEIPAFVRKPERAVYSDRECTNPETNTELVSDEEIGKNKNSSCYSDIKFEKCISSAAAFYLEPLQFPSHRTSGTEDIGAKLYLDLKSQTFPNGKRHQKKNKNLNKFLSLKLKTPSKSKNSHDCSLTCHEQCQTVVSLDCKTASSDDESLLENDFRFKHLPDVGNNFGTKKSICVESAEEDRGKTTDDEKETFEIEREEQEGNEENPEEDEEEKHEEEKQEKEIIEEQEWSTLKKTEESSTLRRTVYRIQSQAVDSTKIEEWVQKCPLTNVGLQIAKEGDGGYRGCLRIHLNLSRPINIVAGTRPPSIYDILQEDRTIEKTLTSFYMPRDAVKAIHITSKTTTREVIVALLRKFKVVDNPHKFALYERTYDTGQSMRAKLRRLSDTECPLVLAIAWNAQGITNKRLVLQENDTADIQWEAFSLPELDNFLRILDREEGEYKNQIKDKYALLRQRIQSQLARIAPVDI